VVIESIHGLVVQNMHGACLQRDQWAMMVWNVPRPVPSNVAQKSNGVVEILILGLDVQNQSVASTQKDQWVLMELIVQNIVL